MRELPPNIQISDSEFDRLFFQMSHHEKVAKGYAILALRSLVTLNAGLAIIYPTIIEIFYEDIEFDVIMLPTILAVFGVACALCSSYCAYLDSILWGEHCFYKMYGDSDPKSISEINRSLPFNFSRNRRIWQERANKVSQWATTAYKFSNILGVISGLLFVTSTVCFWIVISI